MNFIWPQNLWLLLALPLQGEGTAACPATGERYGLSGEQLRLL